jgi:tetratricopeptide (TPR) repeat protein
MAPRLTRNSAKLAVIAVAALLFATVAACTEVKARRLIQEGNKAYQAEKYDEAIAKFEEALKLEPKLAIGWFNLAIAHVDNYRPGDKSAKNEAHATAAIAALNKYIELEPKDETAVKMLIGVYLKSGRYDGALEYYTKEYAKKPTDSFVVFNLADINEQAGKHEEARKWFAKLAEIETKPDLKSNAWYRVGVSYWREAKVLPPVQGEKKVKLADEGIAAMMKAAELQPESTNVLTYTGMLYRQRALGQGKSYYQIVDIATADSYRNRVAALKAKQAQKPAPGTTPATPGQAPAPAGNQKK